MNTTNDCIVIGSGFGGSVSALRLAEKGYSVGVMEMRRRYRSADCPTSNLQRRKHLWMPELGMQGILQVTWLGELRPLQPHHHPQIPDHALHAPAALLQELRYVHGNRHDSAIADLVLQAIRDSAGHDQVGLAFIGIGK